jgi:hypothetical protein
MAFTKGNTYGMATRFQPGQSGNPDGRPRGFEAMARKQLEEAAADGDQTRGEQRIATRSRVQTVKPSSSRSKKQRGSSTGCLGGKPPRAHYSALF